MEKFQKTYGGFRSCIEKAVAAYVDCGIYENGFARLRCPGCKTKILIPFSCKEKICPSCNQKRGILWAEKIADNEIMPVPHRALTFTIPKILRAYFRYDRKLLSKLSGCAYLSVKDYYQSVLNEEVAITGFLSVAQSFGNTLIANSHIHSIATQGVFKKDGTFLNCTKIEATAIKELFMNHTFTMLLEEKKIDKKMIKLILSWKHHGFNVDASLRFHGQDKDDVERIARYMAKGTISLINLSYDPDSSTVTYNAKSETLVMDPLDFVGHFLAHTPDPYENSSHYFGSYSNRFRNKMWKSGAWKHPDDTNQEDSSSIRQKKRREI